MARNNCSASTLIHMSNTIWPAPLRQLPNSNCGTIEWSSFSPLDPRDLPTAKTSLQADLTRHFSSKRANENVESRTVPGGLTRAFPGLFLALARLFKARGQSKVPAQDSVRMKPKTDAAVLNLKRRLSGTGFASVVAASAIVASLMLTRAVWPGLGGAARNLQEN